MNRGKKDQVLFENLPDVIKPNVAASVLGLSVKTIYDWNYRQVEKGIPNNLFLKVNRLLYIRTDVLKQWIVSENAS